MSKYTPGPWRVMWYDNDSGEFDIVTVDEEGSPSSLIEGAGVVLANDAENQANARLIAAAPTLLDACHALLADAEQRKGAYLYCQPELRWIYNAVKLAEEGE